MRFADVFQRGGLLAAAIALAGCAMFSSDKPADSAAGKSERSGTAAAPGGGKAVAAAPAAVPAQGAAAKPGTPATGAPAGPGAGAAAAPAAPAKVEPPPVDPAVERAFANARAALLAGRMDEAERGFAALAKSNPELGGVHANLGIVYRRAGKLAESVAALERAVAANPKQPVYQNQLGIAYRMAGQFERAKGAYEKAIDADPNYALAYLNLGILFDVYLWDSARALEHYERYLALAPGGDDKVKRWAADIRNRSTKRVASRKEQG
jgi:tetratricopeptide (TPR) repeat protein